jgi:hypothetical protein
LDHIITVLVIHATNIPKSITPKWLQELSVYTSNCLLLLVPIAGLDGEFCTLLLVPMVGELVFLSASFSAAFFLTDVAFFFTSVVLFFPAVDFFFFGAFSYVVVSGGEGSNMGNGIGST